MTVGSQTIPNTDQSLLHLIKKRKTTCEEQSTDRANLQLGPVSPFSFSVPVLWHQLTQLADFIPALFLISPSIGFPFSPSSPPCTHCPAPAVYQRSHRPPSAESRRG